MPPKPDTLTERGELIKRLAECLAGDGSALSLTGLPGVGKTALAAALAYHPAVADHFKDGVLWAGLGRQPDAVSAVTRWAEALGRDVSRLADIEERAQAVRDAIGHRRVLLVVDDVWEADLADALRCGGPNCCHLLTTRDEGVARAFSGVAVEKLPELSHDAALQMLSEMAPEAHAADPDAFGELTKSVGGLPLALKLLGGYLALPRHSHFANLSAEALSEMMNPARRLQLASRRLGAREGKNITLEDTVRLSVESLPEKAQRAFHAVGAFAPKPEGFSREAAETVTGASASTLAQLAGRNLIEVAEGERLAIHQVLADVARQETPEEAFRRHARYYFDLIDRDRDNWKQIEAVYGQAKWAWRSLPEGQTVLDFVFALRFFQERRGLWKEELGWAKRGEDVARVVGGNTYLPTMINRQGLIYKRWGDYDVALERFNAALNKAKQTGYWPGVAGALGNIGVVHDALGRYPVAWDYYQQSAERWKVIVENFPDPNNEHRRAYADAVHNIGALGLDAGFMSPKEALPPLRESLRIRKNVCDFAGQARSYTSIGKAYEALERWGEALKRYRSAWQIQDKQGNRAEVAVALGDIAVALCKMAGKMEGTRREERVAKALGRIEEALSFLPLLRNTGDLPNERNIRRAASLVYCAQEKLDEALPHLRRVVEINKQVPHPQAERDKAWLEKLVAMQGTP